VTLQPAVSFCCKIAVRPAAVGIQALYTFCLQQSAASVPKKALYRLHVMLLKSAMNCAVNTVTRLASTLTGSKVKWLKNVKYPCVSIFTFTR
jgi:hypothetical protein